MGIVIAKFNIKDQESSTQHEMIGYSVRLEQYPIYGPSDKFGLLGSFLLRTTKSAVQPHPNTVAAVFA